MLKKFYWTNSFLGIPEKYIFFILRTKSDTPYVMCLVMMKIVGIKVTKINLSRKGRRNRGNQAC